MAQLSTKLKIMSLVLALTIISFISLDHLYGADWKLLSKSKRGTYYYDNNSLERPANDIVRVWIAVYPSEDLISRGEDVFGHIFEEVAYWYVLPEIHCRKGKVLLISLMFYSGDGSYIGSFFRKLPTWLQIEQWNVLGTHLIERRFCE